MPNPTFTTKAEEILKQLATDYIDFYDGRWDYTSATPTGKALTALSLLHEEEIAKARIDWLDEKVANLLENVYPLDVFPKETGGGHVAGIYHGLHILRREARELSAREDLAPLPQETEAYYAQLKEKQ